MSRARRTRIGSIARGGARGAERATLWQKKPRLTAHSSQRYTGLVLGRKRVSRAVYGVYIVLVAAFVVASTTQVALALFAEPGTNGAGRRSEPADERTAPKVGEACAEALRGELAAIEKARVAATAESTGGAARERYDGERRASSTRPELERTCANDPNGTDALAALARFDRAAEARAIEGAAELTSVRLSAQSFISGHPR